MSEIVDIKSRQSTSDRFEILMRPHFDALYGSARRLARSAADAEDLVQEVCVKAYLKLSELEPIEYKRAWLLRTLYNVFVDGTRKDRRSPVSLAVDNGPVEEMDIAGDERWEPEQQTERMITVDMIQRAMKVLDGDHCSLLALHDIDGLTIAELQELTGLPQGTIKSTLFRTRDKLGRLLQQELAMDAPLKTLGTQS